ncbi:YdcF family protein [Vibrio gallaecicus]|uniref:YdcF family protein n=1 Tax=Vibrio gallaecicus TaxID=552386 RepID=UPI0010C9ADBE|nr:YdcF family protein [Vibrio gallaecicus]MDN3613125.1 YdcF family protein [Vibrio gallaecicus]
MKMGHQLTKADCIFVLCSNDVRVAEHAAELYHQGFAPYVIFSGGKGRFTEGLFDKSEAETFSDIARDYGVPKTAIITETNATNTGENVRFTHQVLSEKRLFPTSFILVQKPFMEKRTFATFKKQWPNEVEQVMVTSPWKNWVDYFNETLPLPMVIEALLADFERIRDYPAKGFQIEMQIPPEVETAYQALYQKLKPLAI